MTDNAAATLIVRAWVEPNQAFRARITHMAGDNDVRDVTAVASVDDLAVAVTAWAVGLVEAPHVDLGSTTGDVRD